MSWHKDGSHCDRPTECAALRDRRQRARAAGCAAKPPEHTAFGGPGAQIIAMVETAIETATRVRVDDAVLRAAYGDYGYGGPDSPEALRGCIEAAFRAAGFEVEQ